jgi:hypothetical protein
MKAGQGLWCFKKLPLMHKPPAFFLQRNIKH